MDDNIFRADGGEEIDLGFLLFDGGRDGCQEVVGFKLIPSLYFSRAGYLL